MLTPTPEIFFQEIRGQRSLAGSINTHCLVCLLSSSFTFFDQWYASSFHDCGILGVPFTG